MNHGIFNFWPRCWPIVSWKTYPNVRCLCLLEKLSIVDRFSFSIVNWFCVCCSSCKSWWPCEDKQYFCRHNWWCQQTLLCEYNIRVRIVPRCHLGAQLGLCINLRFWLYILEVTANCTVFCSLCAWDDLFSLFNVSHLLRWQLLELLHSWSTAHCFSFRRAACDKLDSVSGHRNWIFVSHLPNHTHSWKKSSIDIVDCLPVKTSDIFRFVSEFRWSFVLFSCNASKVACVLLTTTVYHWYWEWFFLRHVELNSRFDDNKCNFLRSATNRSSIVAITDWDSSELRGSSSLSFSPFSGGSRNKMVFRVPGSPQDNLTVSFAIENMNLFPLFSFICSFALSLLRAWISNTSKLSNFSMWATITSPFQILPTNNAYPMNILRQTSWPYWWSFDKSFRRNRMVFYHGAKQNHWSI